MSLDLSPRDVVPAVQFPPGNKSPTKKYKRSRTMSASGSDSSYATDSGDETGGSAFASPVNSPTSDDLSLRWRTYSLSSLNKEERGNVPRVKEVKGAANMTLTTTGKNHSRKLFVAVKDFLSTQAGELSLTQGDMVEGKKRVWGIYSSRDDAESSIARSSKQTNVSCRTRRIIPIRVSSTPSSDQ